MSAEPEYIGESVVEDKPIPTLQEFIDGLIEDIKSTPLEFFVYLIPVPLLMFLTSLTQSNLAIYLNVVFVGLYTNYVFISFK
jgi:hypothetical protein